MVGVVIVCHSTDIVDNLIDFLNVFKTSDFNIVNGSDKHIPFGTTTEFIVESIKKANDGEGVLVLVDLGSSIDMALQAKEMLKGQIDVKIADAPILEGAISAVAGNDIDVDLIQLKTIAEDSKNFRKVK